MLSVRHGEVLFNRLKQWRSYTEWARKVICTHPISTPTYPGTPFSVEEDNMALMHDEGRLKMVQGSPPGENYRSYYASVGHSFRLLLLHDAWSRDTRVSDLYSLVANEEVPRFYFRYLNYRPGTATAQQELLASYDYFAKQGQALLNARIDRDMRCGGFNASCKIGEDELAFGKGHFNSMAERVCKILGQPEDQPLSRIRVSDGNAAEDAGQIAFTVTLDPAPVETVQVQWRTWERSSPGRRAATVHDDYPWTRGTVRFDAGETSKQFTVEIVDDDETEPPEGFSVQLWRVIGDAVRVDGLAEATIDGELEPSTATPGSPRITSASGLTAVEGDTGVARLTAYDRDTPAADLRWSVPSGTAGGADGGKFGITSAGVLAFAAAKDYEAPDDADTDGTYEVTVQVSDGVRSATAELTVTLLNRNEAPTAEAGADQAAIGAGATVALAGSGTDPDAGDELAYAWTQTGGAAVTVSDAAVATPTFTAPTGLTEDATLTFRLRVTDKAGLYHEDAVSITVKGGPPPPPVATIAAVATPVTEGTAAAQGDAALGVEARQVAEQQQPEVHARGQRGTPEPLGIEGSAQRLDLRVEAHRVEQLIEPVEERSGRGLGQPVLRHEHRDLLGGAGTHRHDTILANLARCLLVF